MLFRSSAAASATPPEPKSEPSAQPAPQTEPTQPTPQPVAQAVPASTDTGRIKASPLAVKLAAERNISLALVSGSVQIALRYSLPIMGTMMLVSTGLVLLGRAVPAINLMEFGFALRIVIAMSAVTRFLGEGATFTRRDGEISPPFPDVTLAPGQTMTDDPEHFPVVFPRALVSR